MTSIAQALAMADEIIEKRASESKTQQEEFSDDDLFKMAEELQRPQEETTVRTLTEKIAHSIAIVDTLINLPQIQALQQFEKKASEAGYTTEQINEYLDGSSAWVST